MINVFYCYSLIWIFILFLYSLGWSDMCTSINTGLLIFLIFSIIFSFAIGYLLRNKLKYKSMTVNTHRNSKITLIIAILFILDFIYVGKIPLFYVLKGIQYNDVIFKGIPLVHNLIVTSSIFYSIYLSYVFFSFKDKKALIENIIIITFFALLVQRQNILICILFFLNIGLASIIKQRNKLKYKKITISILIILIALLLYFFGIFGNMRYGSKWSWNDSSMIRELGKQNDKYPKIIPGEYFWSYIYLVSPLSNLNYNISNYAISYNFGDYIMEFIPDFIRTRLGYTPIETHLQVESLTVSTGYVRAYLTLGYLGIYILFLFEIILSAFIILTCYEKNRKKLVIVSNCLFYYLIFMFFDNTMTYTISSMLLIYSIFCSLGIKINLNKLGGYLK